MRTPDSLTVRGMLALIDAAAAPQGGAAVICSLEAQYPQKHAASRARLPGSTAGMEGWGAGAEKGKPGPHALGPQCKGEDVEGASRKPVPPWWWDPRHTTEPTQENNMQTGQS